MIFLTVSNYFKLIQADLSWFKLIQADSSWFKLIQADSSWFKLIQAYSSWFKLIQAWMMQQPWTILDFLYFKYLTPAVEQEDNGMIDFVISLIMKLILGNMFMKY